MQRVNLRHVAEQAGVSIKTVSRVVNGEPNVKPSTREIVLRAIESLSYTPDSSARRLASKRSFLIGLLYEDPSAYTNPSASYITLLQGGVLERSRRQGYDVVIHPCDRTSPSLSADLSTLAAHTRLDGALVAPPLAENNTVVSTLQRLEIPLVRIAPGVRTRAGESVRTNDRALCAEMTRHLVDLGHERIAFIIGHPDHREVQNRYRGFQDGLEQAGLTLQADLVKQGFNSFESGMTAARELLTARHPPSAIFASNDDMAAGVMRVACELGVAVPTELSVAGFDDVPLARHLFPALTTIRQPTREMAAAATDLLLSRLRGEDPRKLPRLIPGKLVIRESTAPARRTATRRRGASPLTGA